MPDPRLIRFYDYYDAQLAAHQMELDGHRAIVFEWIYNLGPWPGAEYRVAVFEQGLTGEPNEDGSDPVFGEFEMGPLAKRIDAVLRFLTVISIGAALLFLVGILVLVGWWVVSLSPSEIASLSIPVAISTAAIAAGLWFSVLAYNGYRQRRPAAIWLMRFTGFALIVFPGGL
ncbi:MAG: hypothetical protein ACR2RV_14775 [Verrucomicrobiales bacterium]